MATNSRVNLPLRRRREGKTNFQRRLQLLKGRKPRLIIRKSNMHTIVQVVDYAPDGDLVRAASSTVQLKSLGWEFSTGTLPAAYLAGYLAGVRAKQAGITSAVVDIGMQKPSHGGRLFAAVKGAIDAGLDIPVRDEALPPEERLFGGHIDEKLAGAVERVKKKVGA